MAKRVPDLGVGCVEVLELDYASALWRQLSEPAKVDTQMPTSGWTRQASEPVKVYMSSVLEAAIHHKTKAMHMTPRSDEDDPTTAPVTPDSAQDSPRSAVGSPTSVKRSDSHHSSDHADPLLPRWVGHHERRPEQLVLGTAGPGRAGPGRATSCPMVLRGLSDKYTESLLLQELHDGGFLKGRDFDILFLPSDHHGGPSLGYCMLNFLTVAVARSFTAAFHGRASRHFPTTFAVAPCTDWEAQAMRRHLQMKHGARPWAQEHMFGEDEETGFCHQCCGQVHRNFKFCTGCGAPQHQ